MGTTNFFIILIYVTLCLFGVSLGEDAESKEVKIAQGRVKGYKSKNGDFFEFFGIPYATAPTGPYKFKPPLPGRVWLDTLEAVDQTIVCHQNKFLNPSNEPREDCLVANVFVPDTDEKSLPVVVYIHGGAFQGGSGNLFAPYRMVDEGQFIAVNFNYRLGVQGFLCLGTEDIPGNAGLKDQVALLRWVNRNIASFGGNPDDITLTGYSAGSSSVDLILLSESAKGLFNKVILESGVGNSDIGVIVDPFANAKAFASQLGFETEDVYALEEFYKKATFEELTSESFFDKPGSFMMAPCVERGTGTGVFLKEAPGEIMKRGEFPKLPTLIGFASMEGLLRAPMFSEWKDLMNAHFSTFLPTDLQFKSKEEKDEVIKKIKHFYFNDKPVSEETYQGYINYFGDYMFNYPTVRSARLQAKAGNKNVFLYQYSYYDDMLLSLNSNNGLEVKGANHCAQTSALLSLSMMPDAPESENYGKFKAILRKLWINFIRTGKPIPKGSWPELPESWPAVSDNASPYMDLDLQPELREGLLAERVLFWDEIYDRYQRNPLPPPAPPVKRSEL